MKSDGNRRVYSIGRYAIVELLDRGELFYRDLGARGNVGAIAIEAVTDAHAHDIVVRYSLTDPDDRSDWLRWQQHPSALPEITSISHDVVEVWSLANDRDPSIVFAREENAWASCCGTETGPAPPYISNEIVIAPQRIEVRVRDAWRANRATWHEQPLAGIPAALVPWAGPQGITYHWAACGFQQDP